MITIFKEASNFSKVKSKPQEEKGHKRSGNCNKGLGTDHQFYSKFILILKNYHKIPKNFEKSDYETVTKQLYAQSTVLARLNKKIDVVINIYQTSKIQLPII